MKGTAPCNPRAAPFDALFVRQHLALLLLPVSLFTLGACTPASNQTNNASATATNTATPSTTSSTTTSTTTPPTAPNGAPPPAGAPPGGVGTPPPGAPPGNGATDATTGLKTATGVYTQDGGTQVLSAQRYTASNQDQSAVYVKNTGQLTLNNPTITTSGNTSSDENSSFYGLNAAVLATSGSHINITGGTIGTTGTGANAAFATGAGSSLSLTNTVITASGDGGHGVMATLGGTVTLQDVSMTTSGAHSAPIATDRGGGIINANGGSLKTTGQDSPCYYSTGTLTIAGSTCIATSSEIAVIEGSNTIALSDTRASSSKEAWGLMLYQSFSGDAQGSDSSFSAKGGVFGYTGGGPLFYVTNTTGTINLQGVTLSASSGTLLSAEANARWGTSGSNGGTAKLRANAQTLNGNLKADALSTLEVSLQNGSSLTGAINAAHTAKSAILTLDATSTWNLSANSHLSCLNDPSGISGSTVNNIQGNAHTVTYDPKSCPALGGKTYALSGNGSLTPIK